MTMLTSINPTTEEVLAQVTPLSRQEVRKVIETVAGGYMTWREVPLHERLAACRRLIRLIADERETIARILALEQGKPICEALVAEILPVLGALRHLTRIAPRVLSDKRAPHELILLAHKRSTYRREPYGVVSVIAPWNYPFSVALPEIAAALVAGNTVVYKPAPNSILIGQKIDELLGRGGYPRTAFSTVFVTDEVAPELTSHPAVRKIVFTGSTNVGRLVMQSAAGHVAPVVLELGGKDPAVVASDAHLARAARGVVWGAMFTSGQVCASIERVYVERPIAEQFIAACVELVRALRVGDPLQADTDIGPLTTAEQLATVSAHVEDAVSKGAKVLAGGHRLQGRGFFYAPTVLTNVDHTMKVMTEETFGPVLPIMVVDSLEEAIRLANDSPYGLSAYGWTRSKATAERLMRELQAATVIINDGPATWGEPAAPWGGYKQSGIGRTRATWGLLEMVQLKYTSLDPGRKPDSPWWFPYDQGARGLAAEAVPLLFARHWWGKLPPLLRLVRNRRFVANAHWLAIFRNLHKLF
ncbi:MAG: aldehyde dehydrogenase family protein [candidate division KSB1 bacterium]|nr:aldehyde dehydrogenase family protein [candidate division KSB1 bacterium]MDZ7293881.1 aldehyde dehydrogenase family protein [candidate division KSB1 bacterium]MDZ7386699.1 aldehyde dehydrogenase family protein [candidate division KSB1 bacterium]MDZ7393102.1 aldehyde dehydrogenase family protein [candidate division KSB1 bacterium]